MAMSRVRWKLFVGRMAMLRVNWGFFVGGVCATRGIKTRVTPVMPVPVSIREKQ